MRVNVVAAATIRNAIRGLILAYLTNQWILQMKLPCSHPAAGEHTLQFGLVAEIEWDGADANADTSTSVVPAVVMRDVMTLGVVGGLVIQLAMQTSVLPVRHRIVMRIMVDGCTTLGSIIQPSMVLSVMDCAMPPTFVVVVTRLSRSVPKGHGTSKRQYQSEVLHFSLLGLQ